MDIKKSLLLVDLGFRKNLPYIVFKDEFRSEGDVFKFKNSVNLNIDLNKEEVSIEATIRHKNNVFIVTYPLVPDNSNFLYLDTSFDKEDYLTKLKDYFTELEDTFLTNLNDSLYDFVNYTLKNTSKYYKSLFGLEVLNALGVLLVVCGDTPDQYSVSYYLEEFYTDDRAIRSEDTSIEDFIIKDSLSEGTSVHGSVLYSLSYNIPEYACVLNLLKGRYFVCSLTPYELYILLPLIYDNYVKGSVLLAEMLDDLRSSYPKNLADKESWDNYEKN